VTKVTNSPKLGSISDMLRATNHAGITVCNRDRESFTVTVNLASQSAFLFLATHGPIFIASSSSASSSARACVLGAVGGGLFVVHFKFARVFRSLANLKKA
jgi:hypothetical protein